MLGADVETAILTVLGGILLVNCNTKLPGNEAMKGLCMLNVLNLSQTTDTEHDETSLIK